MIHLKTPLNEREIRKLKLNDKVLISGIIFTARDRAHKFLLEDEEMKEELKNSIIYHCGPIVKGNRVISAGPTTSTRLEKYTAEVIKQYSIRAILGKGGMGRKTAEACKKFGCVYLSAVGGAGVMLAKKIKRAVKSRHIEFGAPEAVWELDVENLPAVVTIDSQGNNLHEKIEKKSCGVYGKLIK